MNLPAIPKSFFNGDCFDAYRILGAHPWQGDHGEEGWRFAVWAPGATAVEVCGGFDGWGAGIPLQKADTACERLCLRAVRGGALQIPHPRGRRQRGHAGRPLRFRVRSPPRQRQPPDQTGLFLRRQRMDGAAG